MKNKKADWKNNTSFKKSLPTLFLGLVGIVILFYVSFKENKQKSEDFYERRFSGRIDSIVIEDKYYKYLIKDQWYIVRGSILDYAKKRYYLYKKSDSYSVFVYEKLNVPPVEYTDSQFDVEE